MKNTKNFNFITVLLLATFASSFSISVKAFKFSDLDPTNPNSAVREGAAELDPTNPNSAVGKGAAELDPTNPNSAVGRVVEKANPISAIGASANKQIATAGESFQGGFIDPIKQLALLIGGGTLFLIVVSTLLSKLRGKGRT